MEAMATLAWPDLPRTLTLLGRRKGLQSNATSHALSYFLLLLLYVSFVSHSAVAFHLYVEFQECVTQHVEGGSSITGSFVVVDAESTFKWGDSLDVIDFWIETPNKYRMYSVHQKNEEQFQIRAVQTGDYKFCFDNTEHTVVTVDLNFHVGSEKPVKIDDVAKEEHLDEMFTQLFQLQTDIWEVTETQQYFKSRDERRKKTLESTSRRLLWFTLAEALVLTGAAALQLYILRRLFERKAMKFAP